MSAPASASPKRGDVGTIMWLPKYKALEKEYSVNNYEDCFDHPVVVLSTPVQGMVEILIITSLNGKSSPTPYWGEDICDGFLPIYPCDPHRDNGRLLHLDRGSEQTLRKNSHVKASKLWRVPFRSLEDYYDRPEKIYFDKASCKTLVDYTSRARRTRGEHSVKTLVEQFPERPVGYSSKTLVDKRSRRKSPTTPPQQHRTSDLDSPDSSHTRDPSNPWDSSHLQSPSNTQLEDQNTLADAINVQNLENWPAIKKALSDPNGRGIQALENWLAAETTLRNANWPIVQAYPTAYKALADATSRADEAEDKWAAISGAKRSQTGEKYPWGRRATPDFPACWHKWKLDPFRQLLLDKKVREFDGTSQ